MGCEKGPCGRRKATHEVTPVSRFRFWCCSMYLHRKVKLVLTYSRQTPRGDIWHHSTRIFGSHVVLDECRSGEQTARFQDLLQPPSNPSLTGRANAGYARVTTRRQSALVSLATTLSRPISDTHGRLSFQRCAIPAICRSPWPKTRNEIIRVGVLQFFIAARFVNLAVSLP